MPRTHVVSAWTVVDGERALSGDVVVARAWQAEFDAPFAKADAAFRLVLLTEPTSHPPELLTNPRVLCVTGDGQVYPSVAPSEEARGVRETAPPHRASVAGALATLPVDKAKQFLAFGEEYLITRSYSGEAMAVSGQEEQEVDRKSLLAQLEPGYLIDHPEVWPSVAASFEWFRARYSALYWEFHRSHQESVAAAHTLLLETQNRVGALRRLNRLTRLGPPADEAMLQQWSAPP